MIIETNLKTLHSIAALALTLPVALAYGQTQDDDEELDTISIPDRYEEPANDVEEESFDDLVFDEKSQSYKLIEDDGGDDWVEPPSERESDTDELKRLFDQYREALDNKAYLEADTLAKRVVELSIRLNGLDSHDSAKAITNLGIAQHNNEDYEAAMRNFMASIEIIERIDDRLSDALINPLQGLAATQAATGRPDLARLSYRRAVHVSHVNEGPHNPEQIETLESMAELNISMGDMSSATSIQQNIYAIQSRNIDPKDVDILPALEKRAHWEHRLQRYHRERITRRQIIGVIERHYGKESLELIPALTDLGKSYLFVSPAEYEYQADVSASSGETYLRRANRIADQNPDSDWMIVEGTLLSLGDYYILSGRPNRAARIMGEAWSLLSDNEEDSVERLKHRRDNLENIKMLQKVFPPKYYNSAREDNGQPPPENFEAGTISFSYTVAPSGRIVNLQHIETQPREIVEFDKVVGRSLRRLIYRPRMAEQKLVDTSEVIFTHEFFYRPSDLDDISNDSSAEGSNDEPAE